MKNKLLLTFGAAALTVAPIIASVSFAANNSNSRFTYTPNTAPTDYTSPVIKDSASLRSGPFGKSWAQVTIDSASVDAINNILTMMSNSPDFTWRPIGLPMVDGFNVIKYAIKQSVMNNYDVMNNVANVRGSQMARDNLKVFVDHVVPFLRDASGSYATEAAREINDWFTGKQRFPEINHSQANDEIASMIDLQKTKSLRMSLDMMAYNQYRVNQIEWLGDFDGHNADGTNNLIAANPAPKGNISAPNIAAPALWTATYPSGSENEMYAYDVTNNSDPRARLDKASQTNVYLAVALGLRVLYDIDGGSASTGHRFNMFNYRQDTMGYAKALRKLNNASPSVCTILRQYHLLPESYGITGITTDDDYLQKMSNTNYFPVGGMTKYTRIPADYINNKIVTNEFNLLGTETFMSHIDGAEPSTTYSNLTNIK